MEDKKRPFPLVADNEPVIQPDRQMQLYENEDFITHIQGDYKDKVYHDFVSGAVPRPKEVRKGLNSSLHTPPREVSEAREKAKRDIKQKRQAMAEKKPTLPTFKISKPTSKPPKSIRNDLSQCGKKLEQDSYILAELPTIYTHPQNQSLKTSSKKNSFDFLKKSQIYNRQEHQLQRERQVAQELNLTRFED